MVCSTCGYENQVGNRFCGMCGTPLPHRPLTTQGAQSTASLTRPLAENVVAFPPRTSVVSPTGTTLEVEPRPSTSDLSEASSGRTGAASEPPSGKPTLLPRDTTADPQSSATAPPQADLVPEIPLHEYVRNFRYVPPSDPKEITMRGDAPVLEPEPAAPSSTASVRPAETAIASAEAVPASAADDVRERLGLEVDATVEERTDRPRYLDFNEPAAPLESPPPAQPISGPSFVGVSDVPQAQAEASDDSGIEGPARGTWRIWLAAAVVLVFGFLGLLEWRAQAHQTNNGPVEVIRIIRAKIGNLTHGKPAENAIVESPSPAGRTDSASKPEIQVEPSSQPQAENPPGSTATSARKDSAAVPNTNAATTPLASSSPATPPPMRNQPKVVQPNTPQPQGTPLNAGANPVGQNMAAAKTTTTTNPADKSKVTGSQSSTPVAAASPNKPKPTQRATADNEEAAPKQPIPGAEEVAKANDASDSAAEAAWLWKATAKGNPAAPVRLANMYVKGDGVPRSCEQAIVLLKTAAEKPNASARNRLASMYGSGTCVQRNRVEAYRWVSSALGANPNSEWAQQRRDQLWQQMTPEERTLAAKYK